MKGGSKTEEKREEGGREGVKTGMLDLGGRLNLCPVRDWYTVQGRRHWNWGTTEMSDWERGSTLGS